MANRNNKPKPIRPISIRLTEEERQQLIRQAGINPLGTYFRDQVFYPKQIPAEESSVLKSMTQKC